MTHEAETLLPEPQRTPAAYQRDLRLTRQVSAQLRDQPMDADDPFHVGNLALEPPTSMLSGTVSCGNPRHAPCGPPYSHTTPSPSASRMY